jgi:FkbM family methyltransferase
MRRLVLRLLWLGRFIDLSMRHPWAQGRRMKLNLFRHKGYWFHGRAREASTMALFETLLRPGMVAFDVGAHIGWIAVWLAHLVGPAGRVVAFEPGRNNLAHLRRNLKGLKQAALIESAVGAADGEATLFEESLTGQNNAVGAPYHKLAANAAQNVAAAEIITRQVPLLALDTFAARESLAPDLVKLDVEGHELAVLHGMAHLLREAPPMLVLEVTQDHTAIHALLVQAGYCLFAVHTGAPVPIAAPEAMRFNTLALHPSRHQAALGAIGHPV